MAKLVAKNPQLAKLKASGYSSSEPTLQSKTVTPTTSQQSVTPDSGYDGLSDVTVNATPLEAKTVTPTSQQQVVTPTAPNIGLSSVTVGAAPQPTLITKQIAENGTYAAEDDNADGYSEVTVAVPAPVPVEEKFINFIDYDGTLLYSWTEQELQAATELPPLPTREGYTYQEWNWDLANLKSSPVGVLVGAVVTPSAAPESCAFKLILFENDPTTVTLTCQLTRCSCEVNWGDGTTDTLTSSSYGGESLSLTHSYNAVSFPTICNVYIKYIKSYPQDGVVKLNRGWINGLFQQRLLEVFFGKNVYPLNSSCQNFKSLRIVGLSKECANSYGYNTFIGCVALKHLILLKNVLSLGNIEFQKCYGMKQISLPDTFVEFMNSSTLFETAINNITLPFGMTIIGKSALKSAICLRYVLIPKSVITVADLAFSECSNLSVVDLSSYDDPAIIPRLENINAFANIATGAIFCARNQSMLDAFAGATNWSTFAAQFVIGGKFAEVTS